jgi:hypothetical protein
MLPVKGKKYTFPAREIEINRESGKLFFNINAFGNTYRVPAYNFQRDDIPDSITCVFRSDGKMEQDLETILPQFYSVGEDYSFCVLSDLQAGGYKVRDDANGFTFTLTDFGRRRLQRFKRIVCRVKGISDGTLQLSLVDFKQERHTAEAVTAEHLAMFDPEGTITGEWIMNFMRAHSELGEALALCESADPRWVITALEAVERNFAQWLNPKGAAHPEAYMQRKLRWLERYIAIATGVLERGSILGSFPPSSHDGIQARLARIITHAGDYREAIWLLLDGREQTFINDAIDTLKLSGYLYQPERRMRVLMSLFTLRTEYIRRYVADIFDIIRDRHAQPRFDKLFSKAFIEMLDIFIQNESKLVDAGNKASLREIVAALAMQLLLTSGRDFSSWNLYRAMLYRYASMLIDKRSSALIDKAFCTLLGENEDALEYGWYDLNDVSLLCSTRLTRPVKLRSTPVQGVFEGSTATIKLRDDGIMLTRADNSAGARNILPIDMFVPRRVQVLLESRPMEKISTDDTDLSHLHLVWNELQQSLTSTEKATTTTMPKAEHTATRVRPEVGQIVKVRIMGVSPDNIHTFICNVEETDYCGQGTIDTRDIVIYPLAPRVDEFIDFDTHRPFLLNAEVDGYDAETGMLHFNMRKGVRDLSIRLAQEAHDTNEECRTYLYEYRAQTNQWLGVTDAGFPVIIKAPNEELAVNSTIYTQVDYINVRPDKLFINGHFVDHDDSADDNLYQFKRNAFYYLMKTYADGALYEYAPELGTNEPVAEEPETQSAIPEIYLQPEDVRELIRLVDSVAMLRHTDYAPTYNHLALARLMAVILDDNFLREVYSVKMSLVEALWAFAAVGRIDREKFDAIEHRAAMFALSDPDTRRRLMLLRVLSRLDTPWQESGVLVDAASSGDNTTLSALARLVMSYNFLRGIEVYEARQSLKREIYRLLDLNMPDELHTRVAQEEDLYTEFKTSLIYPPERDRHMTADPRLQIADIMKGIDAMLNQKGGTLFIGVNNSGMPVGLHGDFVYLNDGIDNYDLQDVQDKFRLMFDNGMRLHFGAAPEGILLYPDYVNPEFDFIDGQWVCRINVRKAPKIIPMTDGSVYVRGINGKGAPLTQKEIKALRAGS